MSRGSKKQRARERMEEIRQAQKEEELLAQIKELKRQEKGGKKGGEEEEEEEEEKEEKEGGKVEQPEPKQVAAKSKAEKKND